MNAVRHDRFLASHFNGWCIINYMWIKNAVGMTDIGS